MVVAEAMAMQVPVLCSKECGAADDVENEFGAVMGYDAPDAEWADAASSLLDGERPPHPFERSWKQVADEYLALYREVFEEIG
jgi:glycosyltransferase involved in cell wall biosynthesis